jgi:response regulator NasT
MSDADLRILIIDENVVRASILEDGLREAGHLRVSIISNMRELLRQIVEADPDVIFIDLENPNRDVLEQMFQVSRSVRRPIAMFVDRSDTASIEAAIDAGVSAYVVDGLRKERVKPILDMTISRFNAFNRLRDELDRTRQALEDRKVIDKAKGILMKTRKITEEEAYALLRTTAMNESRRVADVAAGLVMASKLLG